MNKNDILLALVARDARHSAAGCTIAFEERFLRDVHILFGEGEIENLDELEELSEFINGTIELVQTAPWVWEIKSPSDD